VLALDHGRARTGVAVSDPTGTVVRPLAAIQRIASPGGQRQLERIIASESPELIVIGEPRLMSGEVGTQAREARRFARSVRERSGLPVELVDERLTTVEAGRRAAESGSRTGIDSLAACVLLESYLGRS